MPRVGKNAACGTFSEGSEVQTHVHIESYDHNTCTGEFGVRDTEKLCMSVRSTTMRAEDAWFKTADHNAHNGLFYT